MKQQTQTNKIEWKEEKLGEICDVRDGTHASPKYVNDGYPLITSKNLNKGFIDFSEINLISKFDFNEINRRSKVDSGDIIMPMIGTIGNPVIVPKNIREFAIKNVALIKLKNPNISNNYIKFILDSPYFDKATAQYNRGGTQKFIALGDIRNIKIPIPFLNGKPDLETQKKIVSILEKAEALKHRREQSDKLTKEYLQSVFAEMFSNKVFSMMKLKNLIIKTENKNPPKEFPDDYFDYIDISSVDNISKRIVSTNRTLGKDAPSRAKQQVKTKDIILSTVRPNLNAVALIPKELNNQICSTGFCVLRFDKEKAITEYIFMNLIDNKFIESMTKIAKGASYPAISDKDIFDFEIPLPPLPLQQTFASIVEQVEKLKEKQKQSKEELKIMFDSLMQKAFKGKLVK